MIFLHLGASVYCYLYQLYIFMETARLFTISWQMKAIWMISRYPQMHFQLRFIFVENSLSAFQETSSNLLPNMFSSSSSSSLSLTFVMMEFYGFISLFQLFFLCQENTENNFLLSVFIFFSEEFFIKINKNTRMPWAAFKKPFIFDRRLHVSTIQRLIHSPSLSLSLSRRRDEIQ